MALSLESISAKAVIRAPRILLLGVEKIGKAQPLDAPVLTPSGFVPIGSLQVGDVVVGADGRRTEVTGVFPQGSRPVFRVTMTDETSVECCAEHLWLTQMEREGEPHVRSLSEIAETLSRPMGDRECPLHRVPTIGRVEFARGEPLPLDPYLLGLLLGDGSLPESGNVDICKPERDVLDLACASLPRGDAGTMSETGMRIRREQRDNSESETKRILRAMGLVGTHSLTKFVPRDYLYAAPSDRLALLRGLFDADGYVIHSGMRVEFSTSSPQLATDVVFLARSLGAHVTERTKATHYAYSERRSGATSHRLSVVFPDGTCPVSSKKHLAKWSPNKPPVHRAIRSIDPVGERECVCISVAAPDHLYVTEDFLVTHNSSFACGCRFEDERRVEEGLNSPIVLPIKGEEGIDDLAVPSFPTIESFPEALDALEVLLGGQHSYRTVVTDSVSALERLIWTYLCMAENVASIEKVGDGFGNGYIAAAGAFCGYLAGLDALRKHHNMSSILIGHVKVKRFDDPNGDSYDQYQLDANEKIANAAYRWADLILFAAPKVVVQKEEVGFNKEKARGVDVTGGRRFIFTKKRPAHPGGGRGIYGELPYELPLDWAAFAAAVDKVMQDRDGRQQAKEAQ